MFVISNCPSVTRSADYSLNCTPLSPIAITKRRMKLLARKIDSDTDKVLSPKEMRKVRLIISTLAQLGMII